MKRRRQRLIRIDRIYAQTYFACRCSRWSELRCGRFGTSRRSRRHRFWLSGILRTGLLLRTGILVRARLLCSGLLLGTLRILLLSPPVLAPPILALSPVALLLIPDSEAVSVEKGQCQMALFRTPLENACQPGAFALRNDVFLPPLPTSSEPDTGIISQLTLSSESANPGSETRPTVVG